MELGFISTMVKLTLSGSVMVLVILLLRFVFRSLPKSVFLLLWIMVYAAFVVPVSLPIPASIKAFYNNYTTTAGEDEQRNDPLRDPDTASIVQSIMPLQAKPESGDKPEEADDPYAAVIGIYGGVTATLIFIFSGMYGLTLRRFEKSAAIPENKSYQAMKKAVGIRRPVNLVLSSNTEIPVTAGVVRPKIIFPENFNLENKTLAKHIYTHELIHIKRYDNAISLLALLIACLHWYNPFAWVAYCALCRDLELTCDSRAIKILGYRQRAQYAQSLLAVAGEKKRIQPMFVTAFGKYDIKERVINVMNTKKASAKIMSLCLIPAIIMGLSFMMVSCAKNEASPVTPDSSTIEMASTPEETSSPASDAVGTSGEDLLTDANKKLFGDGYVMPFYLNIDSEYDGTIASKDMGDQIFRCAININDSVDIEKYLKEDSYIIPQDIGDQIIKNRFDLASIDHDKISCYDAAQNAYVVTTDMLGQGAYVCDEIESIEQSGDLVIVTVSFYNPDEENTNSDGTEKPNYDSKLETLKFTLKSSGEKYLYEKVEKVE